jgi:hypothetical protein
MDRGTGMRLLKAFVAKSFSPQDKTKNDMIETILDRLKPLGLHSDYGRAN